jgi:hypothetical protein
MAFFYLLSFVFWPLRPLQTLWRVLRGRPFTWMERFLHAGFRQYVLGRKVSRLELRLFPAVRPVHVPAEHARRLAARAGAVAPATSELTL